MTLHSFFSTALRPHASRALPLALTLAAACGSDSEAKESAPDGGSPTVALAPLPALSEGLSADFLHHSLTFVDIDKLASGASRTAAQRGTIDLSMYAAGPLNVEIAPSGKLALVSLSAGFFSIPGAGFLIGAGTIPSDPGTLLFVDLEKREVTGKLETGEGPMGVAFTNDGKRAFVAHFSSQHVAVVDVEARTVIERVTVGPFSEEIALDASGEVGVFSYSSAGNVRTFAADDMAGTLSAPVELAGDAAGVAFFPGTKLAYIVQAPMPLLGAQGGHTLLDVNDPRAPKVLEDVRDPAAPVAYPVVAVPTRNSLVVPIASNSKLQLQEIKLGADGKSTSVSQTIELGSAGIFGAYSVAFAGANRVVLAVPSDHTMIVVDLESQKLQRVAWEIAEAGPMDLAPF